MAGRLIVFGVLWLGAIALVTVGAFRYFSERQRLSHEERMYDKRHDDE
ncbi:MULTISPECIES: hypothetical protein [Halobacterium]|nr:MULTISPECIES: hypothetical protein [Halobacterium]MCF2164904.1 hypothetical protein [Halobacterium salinarum]MCF2169002.1 hypothetical protein [Halobacterium salinarum]MCF2239560.1 hypothetical protein [Halobacterium salinarum]MDL0128675.1 hypothetical protein [Halobacterium salinarum]MDL0133975.1 hypothetical protein [Halobacterium salinarum]